MKKLFYLLALLVMFGYSNRKGGSEPRTALVLVDYQKDFTQSGKGSLGVGNADGEGKPQRTGEAYRKKMEAALEYFRKEGMLIIATKDFHPPKHVSFASTHGLTWNKEKLQVIYHNGNGKVYKDKSNRIFVGVDPKNSPPEAVKEGCSIPQIVWPEHCVQGTKGAEFAGNIAGLVDYTVHKGNNINLESYSGFYEGFYGKGDARNIKSQLDKILKEKNITKIFLAGLATDFCVSATAVDGASEPFNYETVFLKDLSEAVFGEKATKEHCTRMKQAGINISTFEDLKKQIK